MKKVQFTDEQIIAILKRGEAGQKVADVCRTHGISEATYYRWKAKYGGMEGNELRRLRQLEEENQRLKQIVADLTLDLHAGTLWVKDVVAKKWYRLPPGATRCSISCSSTASPSGGRVASFGSIGPAPAIAHGGSIRSTCATGCRRWRRHARALAIAAWVSCCSARGWW